MPDIVNIVNSVAWVFGNVLIAYISVVLVAFVVSYFVLFDPRATTGGKLIFRFMLSLVGVVGLIFVGTFVDPASGRSWMVYPGDVAIWRPVVRCIIYGYVAFTITSLAGLLVVRKWNPGRLKTADDRNLVKPRTSA